MYQYTHIGTSDKSGMWGTTWFEQFPPRPKICIDTPVAKFSVDKTPLFLCPWERDPRMLHVGHNIKIHILFSQVRKRLSRKMFQHKQINSFERSSDPLVQGTNDMEQMNLSSSRTDTHGGHFKNLSRAGDIATSVTKTIIERIPCCSTWAQGKIAWDRPRWTVILGNNATSPVIPQLNCVASVSLPSRSKC